MKIRTVTAVVASALATGMAIAPAFADDNTTTTVPAGGAVITVKAPMAGDMDQNMVTYQGMSGMWVPGVDEPVIPGIVMSEDNLADRAIVKTPYGFTSIRTGAGTSVLYNDHFINWLKVAPGSVVQLPMSEVVSGPVPHRLSSGLIIGGDMGMGMNGMGDMNGGMNGMGGMNGGAMNGGGMNNVGGMSSSTTGGGTTGAMPMTPTAGSTMPMMKARYGGPVYTGDPMLNITASLVQAGGGGDNFSTAKALTAMVGDTLVGGEVTKLTKQYGKDKVDSWLAVFDYAVGDALQQATAAGVKLPDANLTGKDLATALVTEGSDTKNTFYTEFLLDKLVTHGIHMKVMDDIDAKYSTMADADYHRITNQAMYDLAQALGAKSIKLARFH